jgi:para-nitrobenzyl esterase
MPQRIGAPHACEIEYCMGNLHRIKEYAWTADDFKVSKMMMTYFANFIKTGDPNGEDLLGWPAAEAIDAAPSVMIIDTKCQVIEAEDDARYEFLDADYGNQEMNR